MPEPVWTRGLPSGRAHAVAPFARAEAGRPRSIGRIAHARGRWPGAGGGACLSLLRRHPCPAGIRRLPFGREKPEELLRFMRRTIVPARGWSPATGGGACLGVFRRRTRFRPGIRRLPFGREKPEEITPIRAPNDRAYPRLASDGGSRRVRELFSTPRQVSGRTYAACRSRERTRKSRGDSSARSCSPTADEGLPPAAAALRSRQSSPAYRAPWSMRPWVSVAGGVEGHGLPGSHGPSEERVEAPEVDEG
jgi:hypothetical protein